MGNNKKILKHKLRKTNAWLLLCSLAGTAAILGACNFGPSSSYETDNKLTDSQLNGVKIDEINKFNGFTFDLGKRDLLIDGGKFTYKVLYLDNVISPEVSSGEFDCSSSRDCFVKIKDPEQLGLYALAIYKDGKFVGAGNFNFTSSNDTRYYPTFSITPNSTGIFLFKLLSLKLSNPTERSVLSFGLVDERVREAMTRVNSKKYNIYEVSYHYFKFLLNKDMSFDQALSEFGDNVKNGKINPQFEPETDVLEYKNYLNEYNKLNKNAQLAKLSNGFAEMSDKISGGIGVSGSIIGTIYPPAEAGSKGLKTGINYIKQVFDIVADMSGSTDALGELNRLSTGIRQQSAPDPDMKDIIQRISNQIDEIKHKAEAKIFWDNIVAINQRSNVLSYQLNGADVDDFIRIQTENEPRVGVEDLVKLFNKHNDYDGVFNGRSLDSIHSSVVYISNPEHLRYLIKTIKEVGLSDDNEDNLITRRKAVNDRLGVYYLDIVEVMLKAYNIEKMAIYLTDQSKYRSKFYDKISLPDSISGNTGAARQASLKALFEQRLSVIDSVFKSSTVNVYENVPNFAELYGKGCDIRGLNAKINTLTAACPIAMSKGNDFKTSKLVFADIPNGNNTICAKGTVSANADGNLTCKLAAPSNSANIGGGPMFNYILDSHRSYLKTILYDKSAFVIGAPEFATLTLDGNPENREMEYIESSHYVSMFKETGCARHLIWCQEHTFEKANALRLAYGVLLLKNPVLEQGGRSRDISAGINLNENVTAEVTVRYNGIDYPFAIRYSVFSPTGHADYQINSRIKLSCTSNYPTCEVVNSPLVFGKYQYDQRLKFSTNGGFSTTIGIKWDEVVGSSYVSGGDKGNVRIPRLVINP